jgi:hypothetical protein
MSIPAGARARNDVGTQPAEDWAMTGTEPTHTRHPWRVLFFLGLLAVPVVVLVISVAQGYLVADLPIDLVALAAYGGLGGLVIFRRDGNTVGWLLLGLGATVISTSRAEGLPSLSPGFADWIGGAGWSLVFGLFAALTLVFPSGHLPAGDEFWSRIGRLFGRWVLPVAVVVSALSSSDDLGNSMNLLPGWVFFPAYFVLVLTLIGGAVSLVSRRRRSVGAERAQLGWVVLPLTLLIAAIAVTVVIVAIPQATGGEDPGDGPWIVVYIAMVTFPIAFGVAVLRYRLYDIDRIISRTVSYGLVTATLVAVYLASVFVLGNVLPLDGDLAVAGSTLFAAALFNPVRQRVQRGVDRRFNRSRVDAERTMGALAQRLRASVDMAELSHELGFVAHTTMEPANISVWVRDTGHLR